jgi:hypothetical protein
MAAEQGFTAAQSRCGFIYATGWRSVTQSWTNLRREVCGGARQLKLERMVDSATSDCATTTSEVWNETPHMRWRGSKRPRRKGADAVQAGIPGKGVRELISHFTNARSAPPRHVVAHRFARYLNEQFIGARLQSYNRSLELAKHIYAYSQRTCTFCGSNSAPLRNCSLCMELRYCIGTDCQHAHWN